MADKTVVVRYVARGANQVGQQALAVARSTEAAAGSMVGAGAKAASATRAIGAAAAIAGKAILFGLGASLAVSAAAAIDFESSMAGVYKTLGDSAAPEEIVALGEALREMSLDIPVNVNELAKIAEIGGQLGVGIEDMEEFTRVIAMLATTTNLSAEDAAKGLARFSNIMQIPITDAEMLGNVIVDLGNNFATSESEILNFALRLAPIGKTVGASADEVLGLAAAFSQLGIPAERGATAIQRTFIQIQTAVDQGGKSLEKFATVAGLTSEEFANLDATDRFVAFTEGLRRIQDEGGSAILTLKDLGINQQRTISTLLAAASAGDQFALALSSAGEAVDDGNALQEEAARRWGTTASQIQLLVNSFNDLRIEIGGPLLEGLRGVINFLRDVLAAVKDNIPLFKTFAQILLGMLAAKVLIGMAIGLGNIAKALLAVKATGFVGTFGTMKGAMIAANAASLTLVGGLSLVVAGLTAFTLWNARSQAKARELATAVKEVNDALETGQDPAAVWKEQLLGVLRPESIDFLHDMGLSVNELSRSLAKDPSVRPWQELMDVFSDASGADFFGEFDTLAQAGSIFDELGEDAKNGATTVQEWLGTLSTGEYFDRFVKGRVALSDDLQKVNDRDIAVGLDFEQRKTEAELSGQTDREKQQEDHLAALDAARGSFGDTWLDSVISTGGEVADEYEKFDEEATKIFSDMHENISDSFDDIRNEILSSVNVWDEYPEAADIAFDDVLSNMTQHLADLQKWNEVLATMFGMGASTEVINYFDSLDMASKLALTNLLETDPSEFGNFVEGWENYFAGVTEAGAEKLDLAGVMQTEMGLALAAMAQEATQVGAGEDPWQAFMARTQEELGGLSAIGRESMIEALQAMNDSGMLSAMFGLGQAVIQGFIDGINSKKSVLSGAMGGIGDVAIQGLAGKIGYASPAKEFIKLGVGAGEGFGIGISKSMNADLQGLNNYMGSFRQAAMGPTSAMTSNTSKVEHNYALSVNGSNDPGRDGSALLLTAQLAGSA